MASYRFGNHTAMNMTPRPITDLSGLSATDTVPAVRACVFDDGRAGIQSAGDGFITTDDPTVADPLHFLITLAAGWGMTMAEWAAGRAGIIQADPATWPRPTASLYGISHLMVLERRDREESMMAASDGPGSGKGPAIDRKAVQLLWHIDYWDGPLSGIALYSGKRCWFQVIDPEAEPRTATLHSLTDEQLKVEEQRHALFVQNVGSHTDYDSAGKRTVGALHPPSRRDAYYKSASATAVRPPYEKTPAIGWFVL